MTPKEKLELLNSIKKEKDLPLAQSKLDTYTTKVVWRDGKAHLSCDLNSVIKLKIKESGIQQQEVAALLGITKQSMNNYLRGICFFNKERLEEILALFDIVQ